MSDDGDVVPLFPGAGQDAPVLTQEGLGKERKPYCESSHLSVELDTEARRVYCRDCGREVPAFDYLHKLSSKFERWRDSFRHMKREARLAQARLDEIKRQERNAKSRLRRTGVEIDRTAVYNAEHEEHRRMFEERKAQ